MPCLQSVQCDIRFSKIQTEEIGLGSGKSSRELSASASLRCTLNTPVYFQKYNDILPETAGYLWYPGLCQTLCTNTYFTNTDVKCPSKTKVRRGDSIV